MSWYVCVHNLKNAAVYFHVYRKIPCRQKNRPDRKSCALISQRVIQHRDRAGLTSLELNQGSPDTDRSIYSHYIDGWRRKTGSQAKEEANNDYTRPIEIRSLVRPENAIHDDEARRQFSFNETTLTQFSYFRYAISFRDGSRIVLLSSISAAFVNPRLRNVGEPRVYIVTGRAMDPLCVYPPLSLSHPPPHWRPSSSVSSSSRPFRGLLFLYRVSARPHLFFIFRRHIQAPRLTTAADADVNSTWDEVYTLIHYSRFFPIPPARAFINIMRSQHRTARFRWF